MKNRKWSISYVNANGEKNYVDAIGMNIVNVLAWLQSELGIEPEQVTYANASDVYIVE